MKAQNLLPFLLSTLFFACNNTEQPLISTKMANHQSLPAPKAVNTVKGGNTSRIGVAKYYTVTNQWLGAQLSWKGDFNGDGRWDIISVGGNGSTLAYLKLSGGEYGSYSSQTWTMPNSTYSSVAAYNFTGDFNNDGYSDVASAIAGTVNLKLNNQHGGFTAATWTVSNQWGVASNTLVGDYNGDGYDDIASFAGTSAFMKLSYGSGFTSATWPADGLWGSANGWTRALDVDEDGKTDLVSISGGQLLVKRSGGSGFYNSGNSTVYSTPNTWGSSGYTWGGNFGTGQIVTAIASNIYVRQYDGYTDTWTITTYPTLNWWGNDGYNWYEGIDTPADPCVVSAQGGTIYVH